MRSVLYIERRFWEWVSIEKVFRQIAANLPRNDFESSFQQLPHGNNLQSVIKNLFFFRPREADVYHITGQVHYMALVLRPGKTILTVHDLRFLHERRGIKRFFLKKLFLDWPVKRLRYITAISEATRDEIVSTTGCDPARIRVIENPLRDEFVFDGSRQFNKACPTILQVGTTVNKNIPNLIRALQGIKCRLVIVGTIDNTILDELKRHAIDYENKRDLDDHQLLEEYRNSDIVAFASTYEGFGLPIIEAQAVGRAVITSNVSPMKEVAGDAALLVDPHDVANIREAVAKIISDDKERNAMIERGLENVKRFEPRAVAARYADLYREVLKLNG